MEELSEGQIECLVGLVEERLVALSRAGTEHGPDYRALQACRYALLAQAGAMRRRATLASLPVPCRPRPRGHLRPIDGGKV